MGQQVEEADAEEDAAGEREENLHRPVRERQKGHRRTAGKRGGGDDREVHREAREALKTRAGGRRWWHESGPRDG
ncbi:hypothetical protein LBMAG47_28750 [Planctomycetia bacterium]|nr:hypothetical protein LBMAG47_28750 [Planctomycetia bacterium]